LTLAIRSLGYAHRSVEELQMPASPLGRLRKLCLALPESHEVTAWGEPTFRIRNKIFAMYASASNHHGRGRNAAWVKAAPGDQAAMVAAAPDCFFVPPYVGPSGWVGIWLDGGVDWDDLAEFLRDSYRLIAPKKLAALLDQTADSKALDSPAARSPRKKARVERAVQESED
jgi:hypothetical protein